MKKICFLLFSTVIFLSLFSCATTDIYENQEVTLIQNENVLRSETKSYKNGKLKSKKTEKIKSKELRNEFASEDYGEISLIKNNEKVTVESTPNGKFIAYSLLGKPFIILGCSAWQLLKCCGYSIINFYGGYNTVAYDDDFFWIMPDVKGDFKKCNRALESNKIKYYPEYHIPFTNNKISVSKTSYSAETLSIDENEMQVNSTETLEYDNSLSVEKSISADANATFGVVGVIGSVITVPVSICTWIFGAVYAMTERD